jgi:hypothetical protein
LSVDETNKALEHTSVARGGVGTKLITPAGEGSASARTRPTNPAVTREVSERLTGSLLPAVGLSSRGEYPLDLSELAHAFPLVIYLYPGCSWSPDDRESTALMDAVQHRAFRDHNPDLEAHGYREPDHPPALH